MYFKKFHPDGLRVVRYKGGQTIAQPKSESSRAFTGYLRTFLLHKVVGRSIHNSPIIPTQPFVLRLTYIERFAYFRTPRMSISIRQIFPPAAKFTEKNLADQTGKVRKSKPQSHDEHCHRFPRTYCLLCFALKCYSVLPNPYPKEPEYPDYSSMLTNNGCPRYSL